MTEQSHREEMSAAIRAQRERNAALRSTAPGAAAAPEPEPPPAADPERKRLFARRRTK